MTLSETTGETIIQLRFILHVTSECEKRALRSQHCRPNIGLLPVVECDAVSHALELWQGPIGLQQMSKNNACAARRR